MPDVLAAVEWCAKKVRGVAQFTASYVGEVRRCYTDEIARCGADYELGDHYIDHTESIDPDHEKPTCLSYDDPRVCHRCHDFWVEGCTVPGCPPDSSVTVEASAGDDPVEVSDLASSPATGATTPPGHPTPPSLDKPSLTELLWDGANAIDWWLSGQAVPEYPGHNNRSDWQLNAVYMRQLAYELDAPE